MYPTCKVPNPPTLKVKPTDLSPTVLEVVPAVRVLITADWMVKEIL